MEDTSRYGRVTIDARGQILKFSEKDSASTPGWINAGIYLLSRTFIQGIPDKGFVSLEREVFPSWIGRGLYGYQCKGRFLDIGTPETYAMAENFFAEEILE
jgi:NDP-sugar pyrophosphorylase family protein